VGGLSCKIKGTALRSTTVHMRVRDGIIEDMEFVMVRNR